MKLYYRNVLLAAIAVVSIGFLSACATTSSMEQGAKEMKSEKSNVKMAEGDWVLVHPSNSQALDGNKDGVVTLAEKRAVLG